MSNQDQDRQADANLEALEHFFAVLVPDKPEPVQARHVAPEHHHAEAPTVLDAQQQRSARRRRETT